MWLFVPSTPSPSVAEVEASTSGSSGPPAEQPALWLSLSGKPSLRPVSWHGWRTRPWLRLLSGTTSAPSTAARGVASWIASLVALRARTSPSQGSRPGSTESARDSSTSRSESPTKPTRRSSRGRTSAEQLALFLPSMPSSPVTATSEQPSAFELLTWEPRTDAAGSSCWLTAAASDSRSSARGTTTTGVMHPGTSLTDAMREWATPNAQLHNYLEGPESYAARSARLVAEGTRPLGVNLGQQAQTWRTPTARDGSTTGARDPEERLSQGHSVGLKDQVTTWPTPAARDSKGANSPEHLAKERGHHDQLPNAVALWSGRPGPTTEQAGPESSPPTHTSRRLNPAFVEWLMGWPPNWSTPGSFGPTDCASWATEWSQRRPPRRSRSSGATSKRVKVVDPKAK